MKELFVFDLDGTLAASKAPIDAVRTRVDELVALIRRVEGYEPGKEQCPAK